MAEVKLKSKHLNSLKKFIEDALTERLQELQEGIKRTQERITFFENKYQMQTKGHKIKRLLCNHMPCTLWVKVILDSLPPLLTQMYGYVRP